jgi:hypothetical protein
LLPVSWEYSRSPQPPWPKKTPEALSDQLLIALTANNESSIKALWDAGKWSKSADNGGYHLYSQAKRRQFVLSWKEIQQHGDRALVIMDISVQGEFYDSGYTPTPSTLFRDLGPREE